ncbi:MAG: hypothetical protein ACKV2Q_27885 [Planctomycetaceae bacterium]
MSNATRTILVFESRPRWVPELQRQFLDERVRVRGCRAWSELASSMVEAIVIELPSDAAECLQWLATLVGRPRIAPVVVICPIESAGLEWPLRDAGVREVYVGELNGERLARSCRRLWSTS